MKQMRDGKEMLWSLEAANDGPNKKKRKQHNTVGQSIMFRQWSGRGAGVGNVNKVFDLAQISLRGWTKSGGVA